ncbi:NAD(+) synthase [Ichthyobacterium seriolicida]|uniref:NH(3)-dependent NAD(+) synthetase n=1 Tax=Ichthyobacterium seriolicida TaxID=242600 RepID=A0A1J1E5U8_9FLAO|nr:NAD(+) synthase [Ichthyobacterium seriolicida]BAV94694.1 NAD synthetase [Ichthyobacterium seriolicida]
MNIRGVIDHIVKWIKDYGNEAGTKGFVVGVSGGIDSALTSHLLALTKCPVICMEIPIYQDSSQVERAQQHMVDLSEKFPNVRIEKVDLTSTYEEFSSLFSNETGNENLDLALANSRARLRMTALYFTATINSCLVVGTGNKIEDFGVGFYTKYGDGGVDISPIADLLKSDVYAISKELKISQSILDAPPTDGLWGDNRTDEKQIGASYEELEWAMKIIEEGRSDNQFNERGREVIEIYKRLNKSNSHKMKSIPVCLIPNQLL